MRNLYTMIRPGIAKLNADETIRIALDEDYRRTYTVYTTRGILLKSGFRSLAKAVAFASEQVA